MNEIRQKLTDCQNSQMNIQKEFNAMVQDVNKELEQLRFSDHQAINLHTKLLVQNERLVQDMKEMRDSKEAAKSIAMPAAQPNADVQRLSAKSLENEKEIRYLKLTLS